MSREELVEAYVEGRLSRRTFMRRLVELGVSVSAAAAYAAALPVPAHAAAGRDFYGQDFYGQDFYGTDASSSAPA